MLMVPPERARHRLQRWHLVKRQMQNRSTYSSDIYSTVWRQMRLCFKSSGDRSDQAQGSGCQGGPDYLCPGKGRNREGRAMLWERREDEGVVRDMGLGALPCTVTPRAQSAGAEPEGLGRQTSPGPEDCLQARAGPWGSVCTWEDTLVVTSSEDRAR